MLDLPSDIYQTILALRERESDYMAGDRAISSKHRRNVIALDYILDRVREMPPEIDESLPLVKKLRAELTCFPSGAVDAACRVVTQDQRVRQPTTA